jgi:hypothetical protein
MSALLSTHCVMAQMQPHRAEYTLRLGTAANAPRIGTAVQNFTFNCEGWRLEREIKGEVALTPSMKVNVTSRLDSEEQQSGDLLRYRTVQSQNGAERTMQGKVHRDGDELRAEIIAQSGASHLVLPPPTLMPVSWIDHLIGKLRDGATAFPAVLFDAEGTGDAFMVNISRADAATIRGPRPADKPVSVPGTSWPVFMSFVRRGNQPEKPLFTLSAQIFEAGVLDHLTVDASVITVTADLQGLQIHQPQTCSR